MMDSRGFTFQVVDNEVVISIRGTSEADALTRAINLTSGQQPEPIKLAVTVGQKIINFSMEDKK